MLMFSAEELAEAEPHLQGIKPRIWRSQARIRNVHVTQLHAEVVLFAKKVRAHSGRRGEVHVIGSDWHIVIGDQKSAAEFGVGHNAAAGRKIPLEIEWIKTGPVGSVGRLKYQECRDDVQRVFEPAF